MLRQVYPILEDLEDECLVFEGSIQSFCFFNSYPSWPERIGAAAEQCPGHKPDCPDHHTETHHPWQRLPQDEADHICDGFGCENGCQAETRCLYGPGWQPE